MRTCGAMWACGMGMNRSVGQEGSQVEAAVLEQVVALAAVGLSWRAGGPWADGAPRSCLGGLDLL